LLNRLAKYYFYREREQGRNYKIKNTGINVGYSSAGFPYDMFLLKFIIVE
jgi:hypothetical protein